jgi:hypothetical protein
MRIHHESKCLMSAELYSSAPKNVKISTLSIPRRCAKGKFFRKPHGKYILAVRKKTECVDVDWTERFRI